MRQEQLPTDERDRWDKGLIRHLRIDPDCAPDTGYAIRAERNGGLTKPGGSVDILYTLVINPAHEDRADRIRATLEGHPGIGGVFSPERDL